MTNRPTIRDLLTTRFARGLTLAALMACGAAAGCSDEPKFEARRPHRSPRPAPNRERPVPFESLVDETPTTPISAESSDRVPNDCAPDAVLVSGEAPTPRSTTLSWPTMSTSERITTVEPPAAAAPAGAASGPAIDLPRPSVSPAAAVDRPIVTLAELEAQRVVAAAPAPNAAEVASSSGTTRKQAAARPGETEALLRRAEEHNRLGLIAASKGAVFTARKEYSAAVKSVAAALDAMELNTAAQPQQRTAALADAEAALADAEHFAVDEAGDDQPIEFVLSSGGYRSADDVAAESVNSQHAPTGVKQARVAVERLVFAVSGSPIGSAALHRLGKTELSGSATKTKAARNKSLVYFQAALRVDPNNFPAANDLAVQLAEEGYYDRAVTLLRDGLSRSPQPALWTNLAAIHDRRGEAQLAQAARLEARSMASRGPAAGVLPAHNVAWVDTRTFAAASQPSTEMQTAAGATPRPAADVAGARPEPVAPAAAPVQPARRPISTALTPRRNAMVQ